MIDGKVHTASSNCNKFQSMLVYCGCSPKDMNNIDKVIKLPYSSDELQYGLSTLHVWIRFFECLIHISYKIPIKKWQVRGHAEKALVKEQKINIQKGFQQKMGLIVEYPKCGGSGTSNDGNTAQKAFSNEDAFGEITGINKELIL